MKDSISFPEILTDIKKYMILEGKDEYIIDLILATSLSIIYTNRPVWLVIIAPPSSGKTELLDIIRKVDKVHFLSNITAKTLFSGHSSAQGGFMIREVKKRGIILFPDFTTIINQDSRNRRGIYNQLRVIYDGVAGLETGIETGNTKVWKGKIALIANTTEAIETLKNSSNDLGERFFYYNYKPNVDDSKIISKGEFDEQIKLVVQKKVKVLLESLKKDIEEFKVTEEVKTYLLRVARFISIGRSVVQRDSRRRDVELVNQPEQPYRIFNSLVSLFSSLFVINKDKKRTMSIIWEIALSTIPTLRREIFLILRKRDGSTSTKELKGSIKVSPSVLGRALHDMILQNMVEQVEGENEEENYFILIDEFRYLL